MADQNINIKIRGKNEAGPALAQAKAQVQSLDKVAGVAAGGIGTLGKVLGTVGLVAFGAQAAGIVAGVVVVEDNLATIYASGQTMGKSLAVGMLDSFRVNAGSLVGILAALVTPSVQAALATQGTRTGATNGATGGAV